MRERGVVFADALKGVAVDAVLHHDVALLSGHADGAELALHHLSLRDQSGIVRRGQLSLATAHVFPVKNGKGFGIIGFIYLSIIKVRLHFGHKESQIIAFLGTKVHGKCLPQDVPLHHLYCFLSFRSPMWVSCHLKVIQQKWTFCYFLFMPRFFWGFSESAYTSMPKHFRPRTSVTWEKSQPEIVQLRIIKASKIRRRAKQS